MPKSLDKSQLSINETKVETKVVKFKNNIQIPHKNETQEARFLVLFTLENNVKVLIPAFTYNEIKEKYRFNKDITDIQIKNIDNLFPWFSTTKILKTNRLLDFEEVYLLNNNIITKIDKKFSALIHEIKDHSTSSKYDKINEYYDFKENKKLIKNKNKIIRNLKELNLIAKKYIKPKFDNKEKPETVEKNQDLTTFEQDTENNRLKIKNKEQKRILNGEWEVNDIISIESMKNSDIINEKQLIDFKVLQKKRPTTFTGIFRYHSANEEISYKIRDINPNDCHFSVLEEKESKNPFFEHENVLKSQILINEYLIWKNQLIKEQVDLLSSQISILNDQFLEFEKNNNENLFSDWEWTFNLQLLKEKLLTNIDKEIEETKSNGDNKNQNLLAFKENINNGTLMINFSDNTKKNIKQIPDDVTNTNITFDVNYNINDHDFKFKTTSSLINFNINRNSFLAKEKLQIIQTTVSQIKEDMTKINNSRNETILELEQLYKELMNSIKEKEAELKTLSNHHNLKVHKANKDLLATWKNKIIAEFSNDLYRIKNMLTINKWEEDIYQEYLAFTKKYENANDLVVSDINKYFNYSKDYELLAKKITKNTSYKDFNEYAEAKINLLGIWLEKCKTTNNMVIKQLQFKKLTWWQKIIKKWSWTWKKTKNNVKIIKKSMEEYFNNVKAKVKNNFDEILTATKTTNPQFTTAQSKSQTNNEKKSQSLENIKESCNNEFLNSSTYAPTYKRRYSL